MGLGAIDLNLLVALEALLEDRNVTHAGVRLSTSQSAMSGSLARLRRHFNDDLLVRVGRGYQLTPLAERLLPLVRETLSRAEETLTLTKHFDPAGSVQRFSVAMSDYMMTVLVQPLLAALAEQAPGVRLDFHALQQGHPEDEANLRRHDLMLAPLGYQLPGVSEVVLHDRFVCLVDRENPRLAAGDGRLTLRDLAEMPHAAASFGKSPTPVARQLETLGVTPKVQATAPGFGVLPFLVDGTGMVALLPELLARRFTGVTRCVIVPTPFPDVPLVEALWWHHNRHSDPGHTWLRDTIREVGSRLDEAPPEAAGTSDATCEATCDAGDTRHPDHAFPPLTAAS
jgi:DNA-binding transcriptional LysR family regulator